MDDGVIANRWLLSLVSGLFCLLSAGVAWSETPAPFAPSTLVCLGDSLTEGHSAGSGIIKANEVYADAPLYCPRTFQGTQSTQWIFKNWSYRLAKRLAANGKTNQVVNIARSGAMTEGILSIVTPNALTVKKTTTFDAGVSEVSGGLNYPNPRWSDSDIGSKIAPLVPAAEKLADDNSNWGYVIGRFGNLAYGRYGKSYDANYSVYSPTDKTVNDPGRKNDIKYFNRVGDASAAVTIPAGTGFTSDLSAMCAPAIKVVWLGANDKVGNTTPYATWKAMIDAYLGNSACNTSERYLVIGFYQESSSEADAQVAKDFGDRFLDIKAALKAKNANWASQWKMTDNVHPNEAGAEAVAEIVYDKLLALGYLESDNGGAHGDQDGFDPSWGYRITGLDDGSTVLVFTNTAQTMDWKVPADVSRIRYLVVAGGGAGGGRGGGGGGAGGLLSGSYYAVTPCATMPVRVGAGGVRTNGCDSCLGAELVASGGGKGGESGSDGSAKGCAGGSGGGSNGYSDKSEAGSGRDGQGHAGGYAAHLKGGLRNAGGGGGGSGGGGGDVLCYNIVKGCGIEGGACGGAGGGGVTNDITGVDIGYAGGGGGGGNVRANACPSNGVAVACGGHAVDGGGRGATDSEPGSAGVDGLGGGGGGGGYAANQDGAPGGDGVVIVRFGGSGAGPRPAGPTLVSPVGGETVRLLNDNQHAYATMEEQRLRAAVRAKCDAYRTENPDSTNDLYQIDMTPPSVVLRWQGSTGVCTVEVVRASDKARAAFGTTSGDSFRVYNLEVGCRYLWTATDAFGSSTGAFVTDATAPRIMNGGAVGNVRDLGGWIGLNGCRVRQGLLFRSAEMNKKIGDKLIRRYADLGVTLVAGEFLSYITDENRETFVDVMKIRTDVDLRQPNPDSSMPETDGMTESPLGPDVNWVNVYLTPCKKPSKSQSASFAAVFDPAMHPVDFHCAAGKDRTGTMALYVLGLLGVSEVDILRDCGFIKESLNGVFEDLIDSLKKEQACDTFAEACKSYFRQIGFAEEQLETFRAAMLEGYASPGDRPTVNGAAVDPTNVLAAARSDRPIVYPTPPIVTESSGAQRIVFGETTVDVPAHYTARVEGNAVYLSLSETVRPVLGEDGESSGKPFEVTATDVTVRVANRNDALWYALGSADVPKPAQWDLPTKFTKDVLTVAKPESQVRFYRVFVRDYE